jgi:hypothetical protein
VHEAALGTRIKGLPTKQYGLILADPEWTFAETLLDPKADEQPKPRRL